MGTTGAGGLKETAPALAGAPVGPEGIAPNVPVPEEGPATALATALEEGATLAEGATTAAEQPPALVKPSGAAATVPKSVASEARPLVEGPGALSLLSSSSSSSRPP
jgi:hypothetical protein